MNLKDSDKLPNTSNQENNTNIPLSNKSSNNLNKISSSPGGIRGFHSTSRCFFNFKSHYSEDNIKKFSDENAYPYNRYYSSPYKYAIVNFLRALFKNRLNLNDQEFKSYTEILDFINTFAEEPKVYLAINANYIAQIKSRGRDFNKIP